jgi:hypothetical protein
MEGSASTEPHPADVINRLWAERQRKQKEKAPQPVQHKGLGIPPQLPESCWRGLFVDYRELVGPTTEAPDAYHFASFSVVVGALLGRRVWVHYANRLYPNFYMVLAGTSGLPRKSTSWNRGRDLVDALHDASADSASKPPIQVIHGTGSAEGLLDALDGNRRVVVMVADEFRTLLGKGKQEGSILVPCLTELFSCRDYRLQTRQKTVIATEPFMSIVANTTVSWLEQSLAENDILGGFAGRFLYVIGEPKEPLPFPPKPDRVKFDSLVQSLNQCRSLADELAKGGGELLPSEEAKATFAEYYRQLHGRCEGDSLQTTLLRRLPDYCWKLALLYAVMDKSRVIDVDHITPAIEAVRFFEGCVHEVFSTFGQSRTARKEEQLLGILREAQEPVSKRDLYKALHISASQLDMLSRGLMAAGMVRSVDLAGRVPGRTVPHLELC